MHAIRISLRELRLAGKQLLLVDLRLERELLSERSGYNAQGESRMAFKITAEEIDLLREGIVDSGGGSALLRAAREQIPTNEPLPFFEGALSAYMAVLVALQNKSFQEAKLEIGAQIKVCIEIRDRKASSR
jgi:hypothetical protein